MTACFRDQSAVSSSPSARWIVALGLAIIVIAFPVYALLSKVIFNPDPFNYGQVITQLFAGERLYDGAWQDKPPLALLFFAPSQIIAPRSYLGMELFLAGWLVVEGLLFAWVARRRPWIALGVFAFVVLFPATHWDFWWPSTEHATNLFVAILLLAAFVVSRDDRSNWKIAVLVGVATTIAFHIRQCSLLFFMVPLIAFARARISWKSRAAMIGISVGAGLITWALLVVCFAPFTDLRGYWYVTFSNPLRWVQQGGTRRAGS